MPSGEHPLVLDHVIAAGPALPIAVAALERVSGVRAAIGGEHPDHGTVNALASMGECYLELFARATPDLSDQTLTELSLIDFAMRTEQADAIASRLDEAGLQYKRTKGSRVTPAGQRLTWESIEPVGHGFGGAVPFFIDWGNTPNPATTAPGGLSEPRLRVCHPHTERLRAIYAALKIDMDVGEAPSPRLELAVNSPGGVLSFDGDARGWRAVAYPSRL